MMKKKFYKNMFRIDITGQKGMSLLMVMSFLMFMVVGMVALSDMIQGDAKLIQMARDEEKARLAAEAGINHALALIDEQGYEAVSASALSSSLVNFDSAEYTVTFSEPVADRHLITSVGTANGVSSTVSLELHPASAGNSALDYFSGAGNNINIKLHTNVVGAFIHGDIHANNQVSLRVQNHAEMEIVGDVSACDTVEIVNKGTFVHVGDVEPNAPMILFPTFNYAAYEQVAKDGNADPALDDYYEGDTTFPDDLVNDTPVNGVIYVNGDLTISDDCTIYGGVVANNILLAPHKYFTQVKTGERNVVIARTGNICVRGYLVCEEALVFAENDIYTHEHWEPMIDIHGSMLAKSNVTMWNEKSVIYYTHVRQEPLNMTDVNTENYVISWND